MFLPALVVLLAALPASGGAGWEVVIPLPWQTTVPAAVRSAPDDVVLRADVRVASPGGSVALTLENTEGGPVGFNLCVHTLEVRSGDGWHTVDRSRICTLTLDTLAPGQAATRSVTLPRDLPPGLYRFRLSVRLMDDGVYRDHLTLPFRVEAARTA